MTRCCRFLLYCLLLLTVLPMNTLAAQPAAVLPAGGWQGEVVGQPRFYTIRNNDTLIQLARLEGVGFNTLTGANPGVDPWLPPAGRKVLIPDAVILPEEIGPGITINLAEMRLYDLWQDKGKWRIKIYPVGIGVEGWDTPLGTFRIINHIDNPCWTQPPDIRKEHPDLPTVVGSGPDNPLGGYWMGLSIPGYGIHGTNEPYGVGRRVSHGCIRLYPKDIKELFSRVPNGTRVRIIYQPIKIGLSGSTLYAEVHRDFLHRIHDPIDEVLRQEKRLHWDWKIDWNDLSRALNEQRGVPVPIASR